MTKWTTTAMVLMVTLVCCTRMAAADPIAGSGSEPPRAAPSKPFLLAPPEKARPVVVRARFELRGINEIDDEADTFEFAGVLTLEWQDARQVFDPAAAGVDEQVFQGGYQVNELATGWFPQVVLVNGAG